MSRGFKTFFITFLVGAVLFGFAASYLIDNVVDDFITQLLGLGQTETSSQPAVSDIAESDPDVSEASQPSDVSQDVSYPVDYKGTSMGSLILIKDEQGDIDTILLIRRSKEKQAAVATVIPPDTRLYIDGKNTKLRDLLRTRKIDFFMGKIEAMTGMGIDFYAIVPYEAVGGITTAIKGAFPTLSYTVPYEMNYLTDIPAEESGISAPESSLTDVSLPDVSSDVSGTIPEPLYTVTVKAGKQNITEDVVKAVLSFRKDNSAENHDKLIEDFAKSMLVQLYTSTNKKALTDIAETVLAGAQTNMTADDFANNIDIITSYASFGTVFVPYPGEYKLLAGGDIYYNPDIDGAIKAFKYYR